MANIVIIEADLKIRAQLEQFVRELDAEHKIMTYSSGLDFEKSFFPSDAKPDEATAEPKLFTLVDLILFRLGDLNKAEPKAWVHKVRDKLKKFNLVTEGNICRFVLIKYEDDGVSKLDLIDPLIDDLIYLPLDRVLFLQKMDITLNLPKKTSPRFLFNQEVNLAVEISKIAWIVKLSEVGLAIANPVPLRVGVLSHFYFELPASKERLEIFGKVSHSEPAIDGNGHLVHYFFFAIGKEELNTIRRFLARKENFHSLKNDSTEAFRFNPDSLFNTEEDQRVRDVVLVDSDEAQLKHLASSITSEMDKVRVITESSYYSFLKNQLSATRVSIVPSEALDLYNESIRWTIEAETLFKVQCLTPPTDEDKLFGFSASELFAEAGNWKKLFATEDAEAPLLEAVRIAKLGRTVSGLFLLSDHESKLRPVHLTLKLIRESGNLEIELRLAGAEEAKKRFENQATAQSLDALIMDRSLVPDGGLDPWLDSLTLHAEQKGLLKKNERAKVLMTLSEHGTHDLKEFRHADIRGAYLKPVETRELLSNLSHLIKNKYSKYTPSNFQWIDTKIKAHMSKDITVESIAEYGAVVANPRPLQPGTILYLRKSIYDFAPNNCLAARVYACEEHPSTKGAYLISLLYYGINDMFMKHARQWFRENYAVAKQKADG